jgi:Family of unknown function (DUF5996)
MTPERWPALPYDDWKDTYATLHMWAQIVGKMVLAHSSPIHHGCSTAYDGTPPRCPRNCPCELPKPGLGANSSQNSRSAK